MYMCVWLYVCVAGAHLWKLEDSLYVLVTAHFVYSVYVLNVHMHMAYMCGGQRTPSAIVPSEPYTFFWFVFCFLR